MKRETIFGLSYGSGMDRNDKTRVMVYAKCWNARHKVGRQHIGPITRTGFDVLKTLLWDFHNAHTGRCFPSYKAIGEKANCSSDSVGRAIQVLERCGVLTWARRLTRAGSRLLRTSNAYAFRIPNASTQNRHGTKNQEKERKKEAMEGKKQQALTGALAEALERLGRAGGFNRRRVDSGEGTQPSYGEFATVGTGRERQ